MRVRIKQVNPVTEAEKQLGELDARNLNSADKYHIEKLIAKIMLVFGRERTHIEVGKGDLLLEVDVFEQGIMQKAVVPAEHGHGADKTLDLVEELEHDVMK